MYRIYHYNVAALCIFAAILISVIIKRMHRGRGFNTYLHLMVQFILCTLFDMMRGMQLSGCPDLSDNVAFRYITCYGYLVTRALTFVFFAKLVGLFTGQWGRFTRTKLYHLMIVLPFCLYMGVILSNFYFGNTFRYVTDPANPGVLLYQRGPWMVAAYICGIIYSLVSFYWVISSKGLLPRDKYYAFLTTYLINVLALLVQFKYPSYVTQMFASAICMLIVAFYVIRSDEVLDSETGYRAYNNFRMEIANIMNYDEKTIVLLMGVKNNQSLINLLGSELYSMSIKRLADRIYESCNKKGYMADLYYLRDGRFSAIVRRTKRSEREICEITTNMLRAITEDLKVNGLEIHLDVAMCGLELPTDISDVREFIHFLDIFENAVPLNRMVMYSDLVKDEEFAIKTSLDRIIANAIRENNFSIYYQPIYCVRTGKFESAEALIRLNDRKFGFVSPALFIPAA